MNKINIGIELPKDAVTQKMIYAGNEKAYMRNWRAYHREELKAYFKVYGEQHRIELKKYHAKYWKEKGADRRLPLTEKQRLTMKIWRANHRKERNDYLRDWTKRNPEKAKAIWLRGRQKHHQEKLIRDREYRILHAETWKKSVARAKAKKPELYREIGLHSANRRRSRLCNAIIEPVSLEKIKMRDKNRCHLCLGLVPLKVVSFDHLIPVVRGGAFAEWNLMLSHLPCNIRRFTKQILAVETKECAEEYIRQKISQYDGLVKNND